MVRLQPVHHRSQRGIAAAKRGEEREVLEPVVVAHEPAVVQAVHPKLPQRAPGLQRLELGPKLLLREPLDHPPGQVAHDFEVAPHEVVHPQELLEEGLTAGVGGELLGHRCGSR
jgi:hypothetical protein